MKKVKFSNYIYEIILMVILFFALFVSKIFTKVVLAIILVIYTILLCKFNKKRKTKSLQYKQVIILMILFGIVYLIAFYLMGLYLVIYECIQELVLLKTIKLFAH